MMSCSRFRIQSQWRHQHTSFRPAQNWRFQKDDERPSEHNDKNLAPLIRPMDKRTTSTCVDASDAEK